MRATLKIKNKQVTVNLSKPLDISIPLSAETKNPLAWYIDKPEISPVIMGDWVGSVENGASVNFNNIQFNPHAHGTHTECVGHISREFNSIHEALKEYFFSAEVVTVTSRGINGDEVITKEAIEKSLKVMNTQAIVIRTNPNSASKRSKKYSNTNWPYLAEDAAQFIHDLGIEHLLIDLPSVDKEKDEGALKAHKAFWNYPKAPRFNSTITEFIYVPNSIKDGSYLLNLQVANFVNDAAPSRPVLYKFL
ncbi:arylformamidase [Patiriisocius marinus]|uniref:Arylformamidase n=1 Tax=Patiriisocius marinus TaxID=1397112 RepID=A0A5J4IRE3_9FLAO|nr:cyclase family protein [Patiriisocius marinus]GER60429.1 arylformamidase [Patiriisocius marinus]